VSVKASNEAVETVLGKVLAGTGATYKISNRQIIIVSNKEDKKTSSTIQSEGNSTSIQGTVLDDENKPMAGVTIRLKGGKIGAVSNMEGHFSINAAANSTLLFSTVGYQTEEVAINNQTNLKVMMRVDAQLMDEVVVVGYGAVKKSDLTGSVSALKTKDFNKGVVTSPTDLMQGRVTGVNITTNGGEPGCRSFGTRTWSQLHPFGSGTAICGGWCTFGHY
jgi:iron complex outermembrane receptor protein